METKLRLADLVGGLSLVADLGYGLAPGHAMRSCLVGAALARDRRHSGHSSFLDVAWAQNVTPLVLATAALVVGASLWQREHHDR